MSIRTSLLVLLFVLLQSVVAGQNLNRYELLIDSIQQEGWEEQPLNKLAVVYDKLAELYFYNDQVDSMKHYNSKVFFLARELKSDTLFGLAYRGKSLGMTQTGQLKNALAYADTAVQYFQRANYLRYEFLTLRNLGYQYARMGDCVKSQQSLLRADSLQRQLDLPFIDRAKFQNTYAGALEKCRMHALIPGVIHTYLPEVRKAGSPTLLAGYYNRLISAYRGMKQLDSALVYVRQFEQLLPQIASPSTVSSYYTNAANVHYDRGEKDRAREMFALGLSHARRYGSPYSINIKTINLGMIEAEAGNYREAVQLLEQGLGYFRESNELEALLEIYPNLAAAYAGLGRYEPAYEHAILAKELGDSLSKVFYDNSLAENAALQDAERTRYELELAQLENAEQQAQNQANIRLLLLILGGLLLLALGSYLYYRSYRRRKDLEYRRQQAELRYNLLRAQMNPHFIFNSLNAIQNFFSGKRFAHGNEYLGTFSQLVRRILEQTGQAAISLQEELDTLRLYLDLEQLRMGDKLSYSIRVDPSLETDILDVPPLVLQPFVENAIWHGISPKNGPGEIQISIAYLEREDALHCVVQDDGVGMQSFGKGEEDHRSQGVEITRSRLGRGGKIEIQDRANTEPGHTGVRTELVIPLWD